MSAFCPQSRWSRDPLKMQGFELATIFVALSDFQNFWETDSRKLVGVLGGTEPFLHHPALGRGLGATRPRGLSGPLLGPLAASFGDLLRPLLGPILSSLFALLSSLFSLLLVVVVLRRLDPTSCCYLCSFLFPPRGLPFSTPYCPPPSLCHDTL